MSAMPSAIEHDLDKLFLAMRARPWPVVLLGAKEKFPVGRTWDITTDSARIVEHVLNGRNIGLVTRESSGVAVLDVDDVDAWRSEVAELGEPGRAWVRTGSGKHHVYVQWHPSLPPKNIWHGVKVGEVQRGNVVPGFTGLQQVVVPPSVHPISGLRYTWLVDPATEPLLPLPEAWIAHLLTPAREVSSSPEASPDAAPYLAAALTQPGARRRPDGAVKFQCAGCLEENHDRHADNAIVWPSGKWGCAVGGHAHNAAIARQLGVTNGRPPTEATTDASSTRAPVIICLGDVAPEPVEWIWQDRIARGKLALEIGEVGTGKTTVSLDMSARITRGALWPDGGTAPKGDILLLTSEDGLADTVRPIIDRQGGDARRVHVLKAVRVEGQDCPFTLECDLPALDVAIQQTHAVLAIISPLSAYLGSRDSYKDAEIRGLLTPLAALAEQHRVGIVGVMHLTKDAQRRLLLRAQGSVAFVAQSRTVLVVGEDADMPGRRLFASAKNNLGPLAPTLSFRISDTGLTWDATPVEGTAESLLAADPVASKSEQREREHAAKFLRDTLADGPVASKQVMADAKANGIAQRTLWRAKADLGVLAERARGQTGAWYWMLPRLESGS